jgi:cyclic-di-GMP-binding biofilm dispersal mediator protein
VRRASADAANGVIISSPVDPRPLPATRSLTGASVLVLGASGTLGGAVARELAARGATLSLAGRRLEAIGRLGVPGRIVPVGDLVEEGAAERAIERAAAGQGLDGVVCCVGVVAYGALATTPVDVIERVVAADLLLPLRVARVALAVLRPGGFVLNVSGAPAEIPTVGLVAYSAAKAGIAAGYRALAREVAASGVDIVDARPPYVDSALEARVRHGTSPALPTGLSPAVVAARIVRGIEQRETELPVAAFAAILDRT